MMYEALILGTDEEPGLVRPILERSLAQARSDASALEIEIRTHRSGEHSSKKTHYFQADPWLKGAPEILAGLVERLNESPGAPFSGQIRVNFGNSTTHERYASFARHTHHPGVTS